MPEEIQHAVEGRGYWGFNKAIGESFVKRSVITLQDDDHHLMEMFFVQGGRESKGMEIRYARVRS